MSLGTYTIWLACPCQLNLVYIILPYDNISKQNLITYILVTEQEEKNNHSRFDQSMKSIRQCSAYVADMAMILVRGTASPMPMQYNNF